MKPILHEEYVRSDYEPKPHLIAPGEVARVVRIERTRARMRNLESGKTYWAGLVEFEKRYTPNNPLSIVEKWVEQVRARDA